MIRLKYLLVATICVTGVLGFLPTRLNFDDPDLTPIFCVVPDKTYDLKAITREGIRREIRNLFNEDPPPGSVDFYVPEEASLSQMFHLYYGDDASATRFYKAVNTIAWANADVDSMESTKYDTKYHFDGEQLAEGQELLAERHSLIVSSLISNQSYDFARQQIGFSLHAIQDFYSHTNWYELGNNEILVNLGLPGFTIPNIAGADDAVCSPCSSAEGSCVNNVLSSDKLTSGYYEYNITQASPFIKPKPSTGKCSFGGSLDDSKTEYPIGGINKASTSSCFSPHSYLHLNAVNLAAQATQNYLGIIRNTIGNERFKLLFDLYQGSALVIVIDTTGSMAGEILAVQQEVAIIVETAPAELYILVPYNDPYDGTVIKTTDSAVFLAAVNNLGAYGGGDQPEPVWSALQIALVNTPDYSNLYLFTDAGGKDYNLMNGDFAMAQDKNIICTTIFSYLNEALLGPPYTDDTDFMNLAYVTGGEFISIDDFSIDNVISIIDNGIESSLVSLALRRDVTGDISFDALVDDTVSSLEITISGRTDTATITDPDGAVIDLMDVNAMNSTANVTVKSFSLTLIDVSFGYPTVGNWNIQASSSENFSITADGASTLGYFVEFTELDLRPPRPNYRLIQGQPIQDQTYYVETTLVGWIDNEVTSVTAMDFLDKRGNILSHVVNTEPVDDEFYILSDPLPNKPFYVACQGVLASGNAFTRLYETLITPSKVGVDVDLSRSILAAPPNSTVEAVFDVYNYGVGATYEYYAADDQGFVVDFYPNSSFIASGGTDEIVVTLYIPPEAIPWTESTIVVTASSVIEESFIVNSDVAFFIVLPEDQDIIAPTCVKNNEPDCTGFSSAETCDAGSWTVSATLFDNESGLSTIYTQPSNDETNLNTTGFVPGTTDNVDVSLTSSCCVSQLEIIGVDAQGNIGVCTYDMGVLDGLLTFEAIDEGSSWVYLRWTLSSVRSDLFKYTLVTDSAFNNDVACFDTTCFFNKTSLQPCTVHYFELTPYFDPNNDLNLVAGSTAYTDDETLDEVPDAPINGVATQGNDSSTILLSWDPPLDSRCVLLYEVCYTLAGTKNTSVSTLCFSTPDTSANITDLVPCSLYGMNITSISISGLQSDPLDVDATSGDAVPGPPTNFNVDNVTSDSASLSWDAPIINPQCVKNYEVTWIEIDNITGTEMSKTRSFYEADELTTGEFSAIVSPLTPCANYIFQVYAVSHGGLHGPDATTYGETEETNPTGPSGLVLVATGTTSINATWVGGAGICVEYYQLCFSDPVSMTDNCTMVDGTTYEIQGLRSCTIYSVDVSAFTAGGLESPKIYSATSTNDDKPGPPTNLVVTNVTSTTVTVDFDPPVINPQCVDEYDLEFIDMDLNDLPSIYSSQIDIKSERSINSNTLTGLEPCSDIWVMVRAVSPMGIQSDWANVTTTTLEDLPSRPENLQVIAATSDSLSLRWFAPQTNARCATSYRIIHVSSTGNSGSGNLDVITKEQYEFEYTITGLLSSMHYTIGVSGVTESGNQGIATQTEGTTSA